MERLTKETSTKTNEKEEEQLSTRMGLASMVISRRESDMEMESTSTQKEK